MIKFHDDYDFEVYVTTQSVHQALYSMIEKFDTLI